MEKLLNKFNLNRINCKKQVWIINN